MMKIFYAGLLILTSTALLVFSTSKPSAQCKFELEGVVKEVKDSSGLFLLIETKDHQLFYPQIETDDVVLSSGANVKVCYDTLRVLPNHALLVRLNKVSYLP